MNTGQRTREQLLWDIHHHQRAIWAARRFLNFFVKTNGCMKTVPIEIKYHETEVGMARRELDLLNRPPRLVLKMQQPTPPIAEVPKLDLLTPAETAKALNISLDKLRVMRLKGEGPPCICVSQRLNRYNREDVLKWVSSRTAKKMRKKNATEPTTISAPVKKGIIKTWEERILQIFRERPNTPLTSGDLVVILIKAGYHLPDKQSRAGYYNALSHLHHGENSPLERIRHMKYKLR